MNNSLMVIEVHEDARSYSIVKEQSQRNRGTKQVRITREMAHRDTGDHPCIFNHFKPGNSEILIPMFPTPGMKIRYHDFEIIFIRKLKHMGFVHLVITE